MIVRTVPADLFGTNCWVLAEGPGGPCVVVDPGVGVLDGLHALLTEEDLRPAAVLLTHGHLDHTWSVTPLAEGAGTAVHIHGADRDQLRDPFAGLGPMADMLRAHLGPGAWREPTDVVELAPGPDGRTELEIGGIGWTVSHTPGHSPGSVCFRAPGAGPAGSDLLLAGDLLFAGSIGRTDLPGGDPAAMARSLAAVMAAHPDDTVVLPGHGAVTTIGRERATNPFLPDGDS